MIKSAGGGDASDRCCHRAAFLVNSSAFSKDKAVLPADVLAAQTVLVAIESGAGEPLTSPGANSTAREDVERAVTKWGRFKLVMTAETADLIITVRNGTGRSVNPTISGGRIDDRPIVLQPGRGETSALADSADIRQI